ncbi:MAG: hypothetical protein HYX97_05740 [Chloroflexi bacterium]|nr:hypothetical protein [Chloroflexota bacterium]
MSVMLPGRCQDCRHANQGTEDAARGLLACPWLGGLRAGKICEITFEDTGQWAFEPFDGTNFTWATGDPVYRSVPKGYERRAVRKVSVVVALEVSVEGGQVFALLTFRRVGAEEWHLWRRTALLDGVVQDQVFTVTCDGKTLRYIGPQRMRPLPGPADFVPLTQLSARSRLDDLFELLPGTHIYAVVYDCPWVAFLDPPKGPSIGLTSNAATFSLTLPPPRAPRRP